MISRTHLAFQLNNRAEDHRKLHEAAKAENNLVRSAYHMGAMHTLIEFGLSLNKELEHIDHDHQS